MTGLWRDWPGLAVRFGRAKRVLFLLDFDGTLSHMVAHPGDARLEEKTRGVLALLARHHRAHVAVISGRSLADIRRLVGLKSLSYAGNHGVERVGPGWGRSLQTPSSARSLAETAALLHRLVADTPGAWLEDKGVALGLHHRAVAPGDLARLRRAFASVRRGAPNGFHWTTGKKVWELRPANGDKGSAGLKLWENLGRPFVVAVGDDRTDEDMFHALGRHGVTVRVGRGRTRAQYRLSGPEQVRLFLERALDALGPPLWPARGRRLSLRHNPSP